jgi:hypothetical protein
MAFLGAEVFTVLRFAESEIVDGYLSPESPPEQLTITASKQPLTGTDLQQLSEAERTTGRHKLFTSSNLHTAREMTFADVVVVDNKHLKVVTKLPWIQHIHGVPHYKYVLAEPDAEPATLVEPATIVTEDGDQISV